MSKRTARAGVAATAVGLAAAGYGIAWAASGPATQAQPAGSDLAALAANNQPGSAAAPDDPGRPGRWGGRHMMVRGAGGTLTAVGQDSITVSGPGGQSHTINTGPSTTYSRDGDAASRSALAVGERVRVRLVPPAAGTSGSSGSQTATPTAANVNIVDPRLAGTVQSVQGSVLTIADGEGFWRTIQTDGSKFMDGTSTSTLSAVKAGDHVVAFGTVASDHTTLDAIEVRILHPGAQPPESPAGPGMMGGRGPGMMGGGFGPGDGDGPEGPPRGAPSGSTGGASA